MGLYNVDKLIAQTRKLAVEYRQATGKSLPVTNEIAIHDVIRLMGLKPAEEGQMGFDAIGLGERSGRKIQIKGRTIVNGSKKSPRMGQIKIEQDWDSVMLILMDNTYEPMEIYEAQRTQILQSVENTSTKRRNRGVLSVNKFKMIGQKVWSKEEGLIPCENK